MSNSNRELIPNKSSIIPNVRKFVFSCNTLLIIIIALAVTVVINLLAARFSYRLDLTKNQMYSLSDLSVKTIRELNKQPNRMKIYAFFQTGDSSREPVEDLIKQYQKRGAKIDYEFIDPYKRPTEAKQYQIQELGTIVLVQGGKVMKILPQDLVKNPDYYGGMPSFAGEQVLTRTINKMLNAETKNIYLLQGHGEKEYARAKNYIAGEGYGVKTLDLAKEGAIPADCAELVIAGPQRDLLTQEAKLVEGYLDKGGRLMIFLDYSPKKALIPNLNSLIKQWGMDFQDSIVAEFDPTRHTLYDNATIIPSYKSHEITDDLMKNKINVILQVNRTLVKLSNYKGDAVVSVILESSANSWGETNPNKAPRYDSNETKGPIALGMVANRMNNGAEGRLVVMGTSSFMDDSIISEGGNLNLFYNMTQWLLGQEDRISILPKQIDLTRVTITPAVGNRIRILVFIIYPLIILVTGAVIWFRRRAR
jgi:ABC-2 type transport system permease protein